MKRVNSVVIAVCAIVVSALVPLRAVADDTGAVITVTDAVTGRPIAGAQVTIESRSRDQSTSHTDTDGKLTVVDFPPGFVSVRATKIGYQTAEDARVRILDQRLTAVAIELRSSVLDEVVAIGQARSADPGGAISSSFFDRDQLRNNPGTGSDVLRALDGMPGIASTGEFASFSVRGRGPRNNLILIDDFPLDKVVHFDQTLGEEEDVGGGGRFSIFAPNSIAGAEFSPGGWSAAYAGKAGSLLRLDVAEGGPTPVASIRIDLAGAEVGYEGPSGFHDETNLFFTARQFDFGRVFDTIDELDIGDPTLTDVILKASTSIGTDNDIETLLIVANEDFQRDIENVSRSPDFDDVSLVDAEQNLSLLGITWRHRFGDSGVWTNRIFLRDSEKRSSEGESFPDLVAADTPTSLVPVRERIISIDESEREFGWRSDYQQANRFGFFSAGLRLTQLDAEFSTRLDGDWVRYVFERGDPRPAGQDFIVWTPEAIDTEFDDSTLNGAVFAEQTLDFEAWSLRSGIRLDRDGFSGQTLFSPRLTARFDPAIDWQVTATAGVFYESPRLLTRAGDRNNTDLKNERTRHFSLGAERRIGEHWSILVEGYYQKFDDLVVDESRANGRAANLGTGTNLGVDFVVNRRFTNGWSGNLTYSYNRQHLDDNDGFGEYTADLSREHFFTISTRWEINDRWQVAWRWKYGSGIPDDTFVVLDDVLQEGQPLRFAKAITATNAVRTDDYHGLNIRIDYRRSLGLLDVVAFVDVLNVYGGPNGSPLAFNYLRGTDVIEEDEPFPIVGLFFERSW